MPSNVQFAEQFSRQLSAIPKQLPFATSLALNRTSVLIQKDQLAHMHNVFEVRNRRFIGDPSLPHRGSIRRAKKATKRDLIVELAVLPPGGRDRARIITQHERGGTKRPQQARALRVPIEARLTRTGRIRAADDPKRLGFTRVDRGRTGTEVYRSRTGREFMLRRPGGRGLILRTRGRGRFEFAPGRNIVLFAFDKRVPIEPALDFFENAQATFLREFRPEFRKALAEALRTAR